MAVGCGVKEVFERDEFVVVSRVNDQKVGKNSDWKAARSCIVIESVEVVYILP